MLVWVIIPHSLAVLLNRRLPTYGSGSRLIKSARAYKRERQSLAIAALMAHFAVDLLPAGGPEAILIQWTACSAILSMETRWYWRRMGPAPQQ